MNEIKNQEGNEIKVCLTLYTPELGFIILMIQGENRFRICFVC